MDMKFDMNTKPSRPSQIPGSSEVICGNVSWAQHVPHPLHLQMLPLQYLHYKVYQNIHCWHMASEKAYAHGLQGCISLGFSHCLLCTGFYAKAVDLLQRVWMVLRLLIPRSLRLYLSSKFRETHLTNHTCYIYIYYIILYIIYVPCRIHGGFRPILLHPPWCSESLRPLTFSSLPGLETSTSTLKHGWKTKLLAKITGLKLLPDTCAWGTRWRNRCHDTFGILTHHKTLQIVRMQRWGKRLKSTGLTICATYLSNSLDLFSSWPIVCT